MLVVLNIYRGMDGTSGLRILVTRNFENIAVYLFMVCTNWSVHKLITALLYILLCKHLLAQNNTYCYYLLNVWWTFL